MSFLNSKRNFLILLLPSTILYIAFIIIPAIIAFGYSLTNFEGLGDFSFIGIKNYISILHNNYFIIALKNTLIMVILALVIVIPVSFFMAIIVNKKFVGNETLKVIYFSPIVIAPIVTGLVWVFILDPVIGLLNTVFRSAGLDFMQLQWIGGITLTPFSASIVYVWSKAGFFMAIFLAGMKMIPGELYEACTIDGATRFQRVLYVTVPLLFETFKICAIFIITDTFKVFETIYMLTNGGPNHYSESIVTLMYNTTFINHKYGYGMSIAAVQFLLAMSFSLILLRATRKEIT